MKYIQSLIFLTELNSEKVEAMHTTSNNNSLSFIVSVAEGGYPVFPLKPNSKEPAISGWKEAATTDIEQITRWATQFAGHAGRGK